MKKRITALMLKQASQTNCSPALLLIGVVVVLAGLCYVYRVIILETLMVMGMVIGSGILIGTCIAIVIQVRKVQAAHAAKVVLATGTPSLGMDEPAIDEAPDTWTRDADAVKLEEYAERLADPNLQLRMDEDGVTVRGIRTPTADGE